MQDSVKSNVSGNYSIGNVTYHSDVQVFPFKDNDPYNGINALDIVVFKDMYYKYNQLQIHTT